MLESTQKYTHSSSTYTTERTSLLRYFNTFILVPQNPEKTRDPENRLLSHFPIRRLEAEAIRDKLLAVSGQLDDRT